MTVYVDTMQARYGPTFATGKLFACACGWIGEAAAMIANPSGMLCCPCCGGSGGIALAKPGSRPTLTGGDVEDFKRRRGLGGTAIQTEGR